MAELTAEQHEDAGVGKGLTSTINLAQVTWTTVIWIAILAAGTALRLFQLGLSTLSASESTRAFDAWSLVYGATEGPYRDPSKVEPTGLLLRSLGFFLFGDSDTTVRIVSALAGIGLIALIWSVRDLFGEWRAIGVAGLVALSPTVVFASRTANDEILALFFGLALLITIFRLGAEDATPHLGVAILAGFSLAALIGSGPSAITLLLVLAVTLAVSPFVSLDRGSTVKRSLDRIVQQRELLIASTASFVITLFVLFSRFFSEPGALSGIGEVFADWGRLVASASGDTSTQFFILTILLYEILAVIFAFKVAIGISQSDETPAPFDWSYPAVWFLTGLVIFSFSSGRQPEHAVLVTFPLLILGGFGLGDAIESLLAAGEFRRKLGQITLLFAGLTVALIATLILIGRVDTAADKGDATFQVAGAALLGIGPMVILLIGIADKVSQQIGWAKVRTAALVGVGSIVALLLVRSSVELSFYRHAQGNEMLAYGTSVTQLRDTTERIANLSRDINGMERTPANPTGGKEMSIALDREVQWPFRWYFREFPNLVVTAPGQATTLESQLVIAPDMSGMTEAGYQPRPIDTVANTSPSYIDPSLGTVLKHVFVPSEWDQGFQFLLYRKSIEPADPGTVVFGYSAPVTAILSGERPTYNLFDRAGAGSNPGQFNQPRGVAVSPDGTAVYVLDSSNGRIQVFSETGELLGIWGDGDDPVELLLQDNGFGPYGIATGADGLIYVADTWNHRIVIISPDGEVVRTFGEFANNEDTTDAQLNTGKFYGPRAVVVYNNEIYVTDPGNERVQVFGLDGTFKRAWGGHGSEPNQLLEPVGIAVGSDGNVYVADSGNARISAFDTNGNPITQWPVASWQGSTFYEPYLLADQAGHIYSSDPLSSSIVVYNLDGTVAETLTQSDGAPFQAPAGMAISPDNQLLIADRLASEIYTVDLGPDDGEVTELPDGIPASPQASPEATPAASPVSG